MKRIDREFQKFNQAYKKQLDKIMKKNPDMDLFDQVDMALRNVKREENDTRRNV